MSRHTIARLLRVILCILFSSRSTAFAVPYDGPEPPSSSAKSAERRHILLATIEIDPSSFEWEGKHIVFEQGWIERTKHEKLTNVCFCLKGVSEREFLDFHCDGHKLGFGQHGRVFEANLQSLEDDNHPVSTPSNGILTLPESIIVSFYGRRSVGLNTEPIGKPFFFKISVKQNSFLAKPDIPAR